MFNQILIPMDLAHEEQLPRLIEAARKLLNSPRGRIHLLFVDQSQIHHGSYPLLDKEQAEQHRVVSHYRMKSLLNQFVPEHQQGHCITRLGTVYDQILEESAKLKPDAIVMMAATPGFSSYFLGSNAEKVVRHAHCSVFVIRPQSAP